MRPVRARSLVLLAALVLSALVGCGENDEATGAPSDPSSSAEPAPTTPSTPTTPTTAGPAGCDVATDPLASEVLRHDGVDRAYNLTVPPGSGPFPVVVNLHGVSGTKDHQDAATGLPTTGVHEGFITLTPETAPGENTWMLDPDGRDVGYLTALVDAVAASPCVDPNRLYAAGFSMGAIMAMQLACLDPERFAAIGVVGGLVELDTCVGAPPDAVATPLVAVHGTADPSIGFDGTMSPRVTDLVGYERGPDVPTLAATWAARQGCTEPPRMSLVGDDTRYDFCDDVTLVAVEGGDHVWPGPNASTDLDANEVLWAFFEPRSLAD